MHNEETNDGFRTPESMHSTIQTDSRIFPEINTSSSSNESQMYPRPYPPISQHQPDTNTTITRRVWSPPLAGNSRYQRISQNVSFSISGSSEFFTSTSNPFNGQSTAPWRGHVSSISRDVIQDSETYQRMLESIRRVGREYSQRQERGRSQTSRPVEGTGQHTINENIQEETETENESQDQTQDSDSVSEYRSMNISYDNPPDPIPAPYDYASDVESSSSSINSPIARHNTPSSSNLQVSGNPQNRIVESSSLINIRSFERRYGDRLTEEQLNYLEQRINELQRSTYEQYGFTEEQYNEMLNSVGEDDGDNDL